MLKRTDDFNEMASKVVFMEPKSFVEYSAAKKKAKSLEEEDMEFDDLDDENLLDKFDDFDEDAVDFDDIADDFDDFDDDDPDIFGDPNAGFAPRHGKKAKKTDDDDEYLDDDFADFQQNFREEDLDDFDDDDDFYDDPFADESAFAYEDDF